LLWERERPLEIDFLAVEASAERVFGRGGCGTSVPELWSGTILLLPTPRTSLVRVSRTGSALSWGKGDNEDASMWCRRMSKAIG